MTATSSDTALQIESAVAECLLQLHPARVWIGFSGGADSTALLLAAQRVIADRLPDVESDCAAH